MIRTSMFVVALAAMPSAVAQPANPAKPDVTLVSLGVGFEHSGILEVGYRRPLALIADESMYLRLQVPSVPGLGDGGVDGGVTAGRVTAGGWGGTATVAATLRWVDGTLLDLGQAGVAVGVSAGYFRRGGLAGVEVAWEHALLTHAHPTATYRRLVYAEADGGLHAGGGGTLRAGFAASVAVSSRIDLAARAGYMMTELAGPVAGLPFYVAIGGAVRL